MPTYNLTGYDMEFFAVHSLHIEGSVGASALEVTLESAEAESSMSITPIRQATGRGGSRTVARRLEGTAYFPFNDWATLGGGTNLLYWLDTVNSIDELVITSTMIDEQVLSGTSVLTLSREAGIGKITYRELDVTWEIESVERRQRLVVRFSAVLGPTGVGHITHMGHFS